MEFEPIEGDEHVFSIEEQNTRLINRPQNVYVTGEFKAILEDYLANQFRYQQDDREKWQKEGVWCKFLKLGQAYPQWEFGKIRVRLVIEFCPRNPSQSVDELPEE